jgi:hypothetical protein
MSLPPHNLASDIRGAGRLLFEAGVHVTDLVESMHGTIAGLAGLVPGASNERTRGITGFVYRCVGGGMRLAGKGLDAALAPVAALTASRERPATHETTLAVLNGVLGDHLAATGNPLAIRMSLRREGAVLELTADGIRRDPHGQAQRADPGARPVHAPLAVGARRPGSCRRARP